MQKTCSFISLGCKVNQAEMSALRNNLAGYGVAEQSSLRNRYGGVGSERSRADVCVINTCALTQLSEAKSRKLIRRQMRLNPKTRLIVTGCYATAKPDEAKEIISDKGVLVTNDNKNQIAETIAPLAGHIAPSTPARPVRRESSPPHLSPLPRGERLGEGSQRGEGSPPARTVVRAGVRGERKIRAMLKVQDGCDHFCAYCIIPFLRGTPTSRPPADIRRDAEELIAAGYKEIVLTGINLGSYSFTTKTFTPLEAKSQTMLLTGQGINLVGLLEQLVTIKGLARIRLSSIELNYVTDELLETIRKNTIICPHLHIPLQSGSNRILTAMNRRYSAEEFIARINCIRKKLDNPSFTTDVLLGFPGEEETNFNETVKVCQAIGFSKIHIFPFSPRPGTPAALMANKVREGIIKERLYRLRKVAGQLALKYKQHFVGKKAAVLIEKDNSGLTERYLLVKLKDRIYKPGEIARVTITSVAPDAMMG